MKLDNYVIQFSRWVKIVLRLFLFQCDVTCH